MSLGQITGTQAWRVGAALGLARGEYEVQSDGRTSIRLPATLGKLIESPDPTEEQYEAAVAIKRGDSMRTAGSPGLMKRPVKHTDGLHGRVGVDGRTAEATVPSLRPVSAMRGRML